MRTQIFHRSFASLMAGALLGTLAAFAPMRAAAQIAQLADVPLAQAPSTAVLPNLMYILDDSGSMNYNYMPDQVQTSSGGQTYRHCKVCAAPNTLAGLGSTTRTVNSVNTSSGTERITASGAHNGINNSTVVFTAGTPPAPFALNTVYYMRNISGNAFSLALTSGGSNVNITGSNTGATFIVDREEITTTNNHGGAVGGTVMFTSGTPPGGFTLNTTYFIVEVPDTKSFALSATSGGAAIVPSSAPVNVTFDVNGGSCVGPGADGGNGTGQSCGNDATNDANTHSTTSSPEYAEVLFYTPQFNKLWYNPNINYAPAVDSAGVSLGNVSATAASSDRFLSGGTKNLTNNFEEVVYCNTATPSTSDLADTSKCRYNGKQNTSGGVFNYYKSPTLATEGYPNSLFFYKARVTNSGPHYYNILPNEHCSDDNLTQCALTTTPSGSNTKPAPIRWCNSRADAISLAVVTTATGATPKCRKKFDLASGYKYPRFGRFTRIDIVSTTGSYPKSAGAVRPDCASASTCTYAEELQNFANWYGYYRTRLALMKTSTGRAFLTIDDRYRVGFITINPNNPVTASKFLGVGAFNAAQRTSWYTKLYAQTTNGSTPLREALSRVGRYYAGRTDGISAGMGADPLQYSCQTNYALLTTDGYWNQTTSQPGQTIGGTSIGNEDSAGSGYFTRAAGTYDGGVGLNATGTLADVAAYYYKTDLRTSGAVATNNVPTIPNKDDNNTQHMITFGLGLGLEGLMDYVSDYETNSSGDFAKIKQGGTGTCSWTAATAVCDWPVPSENQPSTLDDLWHAAVNGRGAYFSASDPNSLAQGLQSALSKLKVATAAASASATSSPNITETDNFIFSSTFRTGLWDGEIVAQRIDVATGKVLPAIEWSAQALLDARTAPASDTRTIYTIDESGGNKRKNFKWAALSAAPAGSILAEQPYFVNKCGAFGQCVLLTSGQQAIANDGTNLVDYLRGQRQYEKFTNPETAAPFRVREHILGDPVNATPVYVSRPTFGYIDTVTPTYDDYKTAQDGRQAVLYAAANDGMLHAFNGDTGEELWSYVPRIVMPNLHKLANANWGATHRFNVDGSPSTADVYVGGAWKTVLIAGLNAGGRGFYALDVTVPNSPKVLWEICSDATLCAIVDTDIGFSYGNAEIGKRASDGKWVVYITSGMNNVSPGTGKGFLYVLDLVSGAVLNKVATNQGSVTAPTGFARIAGYVDNPYKDRTIKMVYGGDLWGNLYKFDTSVNPPVMSILATLKDAGGRPQSITTRPELTAISGFPVVYVGTGRYLGTEDLVDPATLVPPQPFAYNNTVYGIRDKGTSYGNFRSGTGVVVNTLTDNGTTRKTSNNPVNWNTQDGFLLDLNPGGTSPGERVNLDPLLVQGNLLVVGNIPNNTQCSVGGDAFAYFLNYKNGAATPAAAGGVAGYKITGQTVVGFTPIGGVGQPADSGGGPGKPDPGKEGGCAVIFTLATGEKLTLGCQPPGSGGVARRTSWRELIQK